MTSTRSCSVKCNFWDLLPQSLTELNDLLWEDVILIARNLYMRLASQQRRKDKQCGVMNTIWPAPLMSTNSNLLIAFCMLLTPSSDTTSVILPRTNIASTFRPFSMLQNNNCWVSKRLGSVTLASCLWALRGCPLVPVLDFQTHLWKTDPSANNIFLACIASSLSKRLVLLLLHRRCFSDEGYTTLLLGAPHQHCWTLFHSYFSSILNKSMWATAASQASTTYEWHGMLLLAQSWRRCQQRLNHARTASIWIPWL